MDTQILLSSYNGEEYIAEQIESILYQSYKESKLLIRDDGSKDNTVDIIKKYAQKHPERIQYIIGNNIGVKESFFELLKMADSKCQFFSFCDQDDVWLGDKLEVAVSSLKKEKQDSPLLFFTSTYLTNVDLETRKKWPYYSIMKPSFYNALIENIVVGTTTTINNKTREVLLSVQPSFHNMIMHDWWAYLCVSAFGKVIYGDEPGVLYRQHEANLIGGDKNKLDLVTRKWQSYLMNKKNKILHKQALEFEYCYGDLISNEKKQQLMFFVAPRKTCIAKIKYLMKCKLYRHSFSNNMLFKMLILSGYI